MSSNYSILHAYYGDRSVWRVVRTEKNNKLNTIGKFPSKEEAEHYVKIRQQQEAKEHNQW